MHHQADFKYKNDVDWHFAFKIN